MQKLQSRSGRQEKNLIIVFTIAAQDAPTSHSAVLYHTQTGHLMITRISNKKSKCCVLVDTKVIAKGTDRFLLLVWEMRYRVFEARATHYHLFTVTKRKFSMGSLDDGSTNTSKWDLHNTGHGNLQH